MLGSTNPTVTRQEVLALNHAVKVKVYNPAKTVADCFKYRNKIGLDVAIEAFVIAGVRKARPPISFGIMPKSAA